MRTLLLLTGLLLTMQPKAAMVEDSIPARPDVDQGMLDLLLECTAVRYPDVETGRELIYVRVSDQQLLHVRRGRLVAQYPVSTARNGIGSIQGSERTPTGLMRISAKIGDGVPAWGILRERCFTGELAASGSTAAGDVITSRILWLEGTEDGLNKGGAQDTKVRHIYIHGTADEAYIGTPRSHGCVRMRNSDVIALFEAVAPGTPVLILP